MPSLSLVTYVSYVNRKCPAGTQPPRTGGGPGRIQLICTTGRRSPNIPADMPFFHCVRRVTLFAYLSKQQIKPNVKSKVIFICRNSFGCVRGFPRRVRGAAVPRLLRRVKKHKQRTVNRKTRDSAEGRWERAKDKLQTEDCSQLISGWCAKRYWHMV